MPPSRSRTPEIVMTDSISSKFSTLANAFVFTIALFLIANHLKVDSVNRSLTTVPTYQVSTHSNR